MCLHPYTIASTNLFQLPSWLEPNLPKDMQDVNVKVLSKLGENKSQQSARRFVE